MNRKIIFILALLIVFVSAYSCLAQTTPYRIRMPDSTYTAKLIGKTGTRVAGDTISGTWSTYYRSHIFSVENTGLYDLWVDPAGGSTYSLVSRGRS